MLKNGKLYNPVSGADGVKIAALREDHARLTFI